MKQVVIQTQGGPLTDDDFAAEAPSPGVSDARYSGDGKKKIASIAARVAEEVKAKKALS